MTESRIPILPLIDRDGCVTVTITAHTFIYGDTESVEICVTVRILIRVKNILHINSAIIAFGLASMVSLKRTL